MLSALCGGIRVVSLYAPNGRVVDSPFYRAKLTWCERLARWLRDACDPGEPLVLGGDFNVAPGDIDVWDPAACHGGTHVSEPERQAFGRLCQWGLVDAYRLQHPDPGRYTWWDYRAGNFHKNFGMRIDHLLVSPPIAGRTVWAEIDREARKGNPLPSDHAPLVIDLPAPTRMPVRRRVSGRRGAHRGPPGAGPVSARLTTPSRRTLPEEHAGEFGFGQARRPQILSGRVSGDGQDPRDLLDGDTPVARHARSHRAPGPRRARSDTGSWLTTSRQTPRWLLLPCRRRRVNSLADDGSLVGPTTS